MATKQTDTVAMTEEQLDAVAGGLRDVQVVSYEVKRMRRRSNGTLHSRASGYTDSGRITYLEHGPGFLPWHRGQY
jgi:hypothetical protein